MLLDLRLCANEIPPMGSGGYFSGVAYIGLREVEMTAKLHGWNENPIMLSIFIHKTRWHASEWFLCIWMPSGGGDFVAILTYKSWTTENYGVNRNIKRWCIRGFVAHMSRYRAHTFSFQKATARPMNLYILISAENKRHSKEGPDTDQLGRRLASEHFAAVCYFRGETYRQLKRETMPAVLE